MAVQPTAADPTRPILIAVLEVGFRAKPEALDVEDDLPLSADSGRSLMIAYRDSGSRGRLPIPSR